MHAAQRREPMLPRRVGLATVGMLSHISDCRPGLFGRVLPFRAARIISDLICTTVSVLLGALASIGTVITALYIGPRISFFRRAASEP